MSEEMKSTELSIVVDDGYKRVPIKNEMGEQVGVFCFNPTDIGILDRFRNSEAKLSEIVRPLKEVSINVDGESEDAEEMEKIDEVKNNLFEFCNYLFGGDMAEAFFGRVHPFSPVNGKFYCENVLDAVAKFISLQFADEEKKVKDRVAKYTHGYRTGKHKGGRK